MKVAGADIWKGRWVVVLLADGRFDRAFVASTIETAIAEIPEIVVLGVDIPIGLPASGQRRPADEEARRYVGPRWQSVFMTPSIDLLKAPTHAKANELAKSEGWDGVSAQAYALGPHILEVQQVAGRDTRVYEVHPEVSFVRANDNVALQWSKTSWNGVALRRRILENHGISLPDDLAEVGSAGVADILDAAIAAWSAARVARGRAESLPAGAERIGAIWR